MASLFVALGGGAAAYAGGLISGSQIKNHSIPAKKLTKSAIKSLRGQREPAGRQGATGATGAAGAPGAPGAPGSPGFVSVGGWAGSISAIPPASSGFVFAGPTTTLTTNASQSIVASGSAALATSLRPDADRTSRSVRVADGGQHAVHPGLRRGRRGARIRWGGGPFTSTYAVSETGAPGAGTWDVGMCVVNEDSTTPIDQNQSSVGYAFVVNGTPVSELPKTTSKSSHQ